MHTKPLGAQDVCLAFSVWTLGVLCPLFSLICDSAIYTMYLLIEDIQNILSVKVYFHFPQND